MATRQQLQSFERVGLNLYLAGAAAAVTERAGLGEAVKVELLCNALEHAGTHAEVAKAFAQRLQATAERPRFRQLMDAGHAAMTTVAEGHAGADLPPLPDLIQLWSDPNVRGAEVKKVTFVLTNIVGLAALTAKSGNSVAQRVVRAHNGAVRTAVKNFRGAEVKHTGDGILLTFPDAASACRAAIEIQYEGSGYTKDNPDAPLVMRLGIHTGEATLEDGEYSGPALTVLNGICAAAGEHQIFCSEPAKARAIGPAFRFQSLGRRKLSDGQIEVSLYKLDWTPKVRMSQGSRAYGQSASRKP